MISGLSRSAAACSAATSSTARKALSFLRKPICARLSSCSMKLWPLRCLEGEEGGHTHHQGAENFIADVEVVVGEAAALVGKDAVVRVLGGVFRHADAEGRPLLHALQDVIDAVGVVLCHSTLPGKDMVFLPHALLGPRDRGMMITGEGFHPVLVVGGALAQDFLAHHWNAEHLAEEVHHLLGPRQGAEVTVNDNAVEAVVNKRQEVAEQLGEYFHGRHR